MSFYHYDIWVCNQLTTLSNVFNKCKVGRQISNFTFCIFIGCTIIREQIGICYLLKKWNFNM